MLTACSESRLMQEPNADAGKQRTGPAHAQAVLALDGTSLAHYRAYEDALGVKCVAWSPSSHLLAVGSFDQAGARPGVAAWGAQACSSDSRARRAQEVRLLHHANWLPVASLAHTERLAAGPDALVVYREVTATHADALPAAGKGAQTSSRATGSAGGGRTAGHRADGTGAASSGACDQPAGWQAPGARQSHFVVCELPIRLPSLRPAADKQPRAGIGAPTARMQEAQRGNAGLLTCCRAQGGPCGALTDSCWQPGATRSRSARGCGAFRSWSWPRWCSRWCPLCAALPCMPMCGHAPEGALLCQAEPILDMEWHPEHPRLAIVTGGARLYLWSAEGASCVSIPLPHFQATSLRWSPSGASLALGDRASGTFCCAFLA